MGRENDHRSHVASTLHALRRVREGRAPQLVEEVEEPVGGHLDRLHENGEVAQSSLAVLADALGHVLTGAVVASHLE